MSDVKLATAPVTWGVWERTIERDDLPTPRSLLGAGADLGYPGIELGPLGYFGSEPGEVHAMLGQAGLELAGAFVELRLVDADDFRADIPALEQTLAILGGTDATLLVADAGSPERRAASGKPAELRRTSLGASAFSAATARLEHVLEGSLDAGVRCAFHPHAASYVESAAETERLVEDTPRELGICLDTGHSVIGGADPVALANSLGDRITHLHLKDVDGPIRQRVEAGELSVDEAWAEGLFCPFGEGEVDLEGFLSLPGIRSFGGWAVLEQDRIAVRQQDLDSVLQVERRNRERVVRWSGWAAEAPA